ncbi:hypothetical protein E0198_003310 [Clavispora lusitaniae]|nr:hypothetical protein E0198_003310 [Clavispora lusitaniae]
MPPKQPVTILKFKRARSTYVIPIQLTVKKNFTIASFTETLAEAINLSGGLHIIEDGSMADEGEPDEGLQVKASDLTIALPKVKETPYDNVWIPVEDDSTLQTIVFQDYDIIAFKFGDDVEFRIEQPEYED